jgi:quinol monooxygenase YgiN
MVKVISKTKVKADKVDAFIDLFKEMVEPTGKEEGCIQYEMYRDEDEPSILVAVEKWETRTAFDRHLLTDHFKRIVPAMSELMDGETDMIICRRIV